jgi:putative Holliday junction resolvase
MPLRTVLGFDFGMRHIGVAVGQAISMTTQSCNSLYAQQGIPYWERINALLKIWQPDALIVGVPLHLDGREHKITLAARHFIKGLTMRFTLPVHPAEERLTTVEARARLFAQGGYKSLSKQAIDGLSACLILEGWLTEYGLSQGENR